MFAKQMFDCPVPVDLTSFVALRRALPRALIALDYDGTLAPIVRDPADSRPQAGALNALLALVPRVGQLVIITGRPALFVVETGGLARVPGLLVLGQYGAERWQAGRLTTRLPLPGLQTARAALVDLPAGARLEDKGTALAVHTRQAADPAGLLLALRPQLEKLATATGLACHLGRYVLELRPPGDDKGRALTALLRPLPSGVLYAGDDVGDLPAFTALDGLDGLDGLSGLDGLDSLDSLAGAAGPAVIGGVAGVAGAAAAGGQAVPVLRVCSDSAEAPAELRERADLLVDGPAGVVALLEALLS